MIVAFIGAMAACTRLLQHPRPMGVPVDFSVASAETLDDSQYQSRDPAGVMGVLPFLGLRKSL